MKVYLLITGLVLGALGLYVLFDPQGATSAQAGVRLENVAALSYMRGTGGGVTLAVGVFLLAAFTRTTLERPALWTVVLILGGLEIGRLVSFLIDGSPPPSIAVAIFFENLGLWQAVYWLARRPLPNRLK